MTAEQPDGAYAPLENRCVTVSVFVPDGISDCELLEQALNDLKDEASNSGRVVTSVQIQSTNAGSATVVYTIIAQWIGSETLKQMQRMNQIAAGGGNGGKMGLV